MEYSSLNKKYNGFRDPIIEIVVNDTSFTAGGSRKVAVGVSNVSIDLTAGFEASQAVFNIYNVYEYDKARFNFDSVKKFVLIGSSVTIYVGYGTEITEVFKGFITRVAFNVEEDDMASIQVTAMDIKAIMMSNRYSRRLKATNYSDAVKEIFNQNIYQSLKNSGSVTDFSVEATPDNPAGGLGGGASAGADNDTDKTIEMVGESDYEFVVKVAKKFNYDFFTVGGKVYFRKAKSDQTKQITISPDSKIKKLYVDYDITGLVEEIEVRGLDVGKAKGVTGKKKNSNKLSQGNKAKALLSGSKFVYIDPTVSDTSDASYRANYLFENNSYRYGTLELDIAGLPEIVPGKYIKLSDFGTAVSNDFYVQSVRHTFSAQGAFITHIVGKTDKQSSGGLF